MTAPHFRRDGEDPLLTTRETAQRLGVSLRTVQLWVEAGHIPAGRTPGGHRRIRTSAVDRLVGKTGIQQAAPIAESVEGLKRRADVASAALRELLRTARDAGLGDTPAALRAVIALGGDV